MKLIRAIICIYLALVVQAEESSILKNARVSQYDISARMSTGGQNGLIDGNFASLLYSNVKHEGDGTKEFAIDLMRPETITCTFVSNRSGKLEW